MQIPSGDASRSCAFYRRVFGWEADGDRFTDGTGHVIGHFVEGRRISDDAGIRPYVFVSEVDATLDLVTRHGGTVAQPPYAEGDLRVATFRRPYGNVIGVWRTTGGA